MSILITPAQLAEMLDGPNPPLLLDVRWKLTQDPASGGQLEEYQNGHIPAARFVDLDAELSANPHADGLGGRHPLPEPAVFEAAMRALGVQDDRPVVAYDARTSISAARLWWLLTDAGLTDVHVLDGGFAAWQAAGLPVEEGPSVPAVGSDWEAKPGRRDRVDADGVQAAVAAGRRVIDVRAAERYRGESEPIDPVAGHIPGAESLPATSLQASDGTFLPADEIRGIVGEIGPGDVLSCGSGITASQALLALENAGYDGAVIYPGSWSDWCARELPAATGDGEA